jgi:CRP/FNR family transcriptional regulator, cyclic AMP receptor protein
MTMVSAEFLSKIPIFENLSPADHDTLADLWHKRDLKESEVLFHVGDKGDAMYVIQKGVIDIRVPLQGPKKEMTVSVLHEGEFFGELSIIDGLPRTATAIAGETTELLEMKRSEFMKFLMDRPAVAISMVSIIGKRLRDTNELVQSLASKNVNEEMDERLSVGDRLADKIAEFGGSWAFIIMFLVSLVAWISLNSIQLWFKPFDEYPFIFLNLILSCISAIQAPLIMMSQNRAQKKDRLRAELDYQVNLKSELMLQQLHAKIDELRATDLHHMNETIQTHLTNAPRASGNPFDSSTLGSKS